MLDDNSVDRAGPYEVGGALGAGGKWAGGVHAMNVAECASISRFEYFVIKIIEQ